MKNSQKNRLRVAIIVFSPSGNTLSTAESIEQSFLSRGAHVQVLNLTGKKEINHRASIIRYLKETVKPHDVLCIGGPVYAGHLQQNVKNIIKCLPSPNATWGSLSVPFVSYGGIHSSVALKEAGALLRNKGRKNILGIKIAASHSLTQKFDFSINEHKPGLDEMELIESMADKVLETTSFNAGEIKDVSKSFSYIGFTENLAYRVFSEKTLHKIMFGKREFLFDKCTGCGLCAKKCPTQIIKMKDKKPHIAKKDTSKCCYCTECYNKCKFDAISWDLSKSKKYLSHMKTKKKFETQQSALYSI